MTATDQSTTAEPPPRTSRVRPLRTIAATAVIGAVAAVTVALVLPSGDEPESNAAPGADGSATVCDLIPADLIEQAAPGSIGFLVPADGGSACRWSVLVEDTPGRRDHREVALTVTSTSDPTVKLAEARATLAALDPAPEITEITEPGDGGFRALLDPSDHRFLEHSLVGLSYTTGTVSVDIELTGWMKEGASPTRNGVPTSDLQPVADQIAAAVAERLPKADEASAESVAPVAEHPIGALPEDGCALLTDEIVSEYVSESSETSTLDELDYPNCHAGGDLDPTARADGATHRSVDLFVRTADDVDQAATWYVEQVARTYQYGLDDVSRAGEVTEIADDADEAFVISGTSTASLPAIYGASTVVVRRGDAIVTASLQGDRSTGDAQEPISPEDVEAEAIELTKMVLAQL